MNLSSMVRKLRIINSRLSRNGGHSEKAHEGQSFAKTGYRLQGCYRCQLLSKAGNLQIRIQQLEAKETPLRMVN